MRHTRMRQIAKAHREEEHSREWRDEVGTDPIDFICHCKSLGLSPQLDLTFKWHRKNEIMQFVTWKTEDEMAAFRGDNLVYVKTYK